jgi:putative transposase
MEAATSLAPMVGIAPTCRALGLSRASFYRAAGPPVVPVIPSSDAPSRRQSPRALDPTEQQAVLDQLHAPRFADRSPTEVYATLLDEGVYLASERTFYRLLADKGETRERRDQLAHPTYHKPELLAVRPNEVWSWDITRLLGPAKWTYFYLYVVLDIFSRYVVGWMVATREAADLAEHLIAETLTKQQIAIGALTIHADRGAAMLSKPVALLLADLGVTKSHSRPHTSNDNPFSEAQFKTLKYRPGFPERFTSIEEARGFCQEFFPWYNAEHRHAGIGLMPPEAVHYGRASDLYATRAVILGAAYLAHPERFVNGRPVPPPLPTAVWINPPETPRKEEVSQ